MRRNWMPLYIPDFLADTMRLSAAETGAYLCLIMDYWMHDGLPDDDAQLAAIARLPLKSWRQMRPTIEAFFHDGWSHKRIDAELDKMVTTMTKRHAAAVKAGTMSVISRERNRQRNVQRPLNESLPQRSTSDQRSVNHTTQERNITTTTSSAARDAALQENPEKPTIEPADVPVGSPGEGGKSSRISRTSGKSCEEIPMTEKLQKVSVIPPEEPAGPAPSVTPLDMLNRAVLAGADIAMIEKLMALHERWDANQARKAFDEAVAAAKRDIPPITRNVQGHNAKKYADFAAIATVVDPIIGAQGLSYRFRTVQNDRISVTCILSHKAGHSEETTLSGPADTSGAKNAIQAIGSTLTYLQRYSLVQMLGLAAGNDDDGKAAGDGKTITEEQLLNLIDLADDVGADKEAFCKYFNVPSLADIQAKDLPRAIAALNKKRAK